MYSTMYIAHGEQLLGQPITNENTSFVFEFGIMSINELRLKCWYVQNDQGATTNNNNNYKVTLRSLHNNNQKRITTK